MLKPEWMDDDFAHDTMRYTLTRMSHVAARHRAYIYQMPARVEKLAAQQKAKKEGDEAG